MSRKIQYGGEYEEAKKWNINFEEMIGVKHLSHSPSCDCFLHDSCIKKTAVCRCWNDEGRILIATASKIFSRWKVAVSYCDCSPCA